ncbi:hypothetical protein Gotri_023091 [Gossypium trilobum]|uniref:Protein kinase domain-containing protein n=1 Tax=Gossypium trilobum TaxID=34281 RepID=A0A7J9DI52_9ROSI|nr:hypothetical protein [Gossypium trilobum]
MVEFGYEQLVKATQSFCPSRLIGKGSHGAVYQGVLQDNRVVAVKRSSINGVEAQRDNLKKLENEISILSSLRQSCNVISFLGASHDSVQNDKLLVMELMPNGSLHDLLHVSATPPSWPQRVEIALQIARAVQFLHESKPSVIHRDIKSANILFDSNWTAKLCDFGLAISPADSLSQATQPAVLLEIISCRKVIDVTKAPASIVEWAIPLVKKQRVVEICDSRIPFPMYMESRIRRILSVASRCLSDKEERRPSIGEIIVAMETCSIEPVRSITTWNSVIQYLVQLKRRRKLSGEYCIRSAVYSTRQGEDVNSHVSTGKVVLLKEMLADVRLK